MPQPTSLSLRPHQRFHVIAAAAWPLPIYAWFAWGHALYGFRLDDAPFQSPVEDTAIMIAQICAILLELYLVATSIRISSTDASFQKVARIHAKIFFGLAFSIWMPVQTYVNELRNFERISHQPEFVPTDPVGAAIFQTVSVFVPLAFMLGFFWFGVTLISQVLKTIQSFRRESEDDGTKITEI